MLEIISLQGVIIITPHKEKTQYYFILKTQDFSGSNYYVFRLHRPNVNATKQNCLKNKHKFYSTL